jgi:hypothetical protein
VSVTPRFRGSSIAAWSLIASALYTITLVPYAVAWRWAGGEVTYLGLLFDVPDHTQYWAWVRASHQGLFISNTMTPEPNPATFMNPMMWVLAQVQRVGGFDFPILFQLWRVAAVLIVVAAVAWMTREFVADPAVRRTARWVMLTGAGLGWMLIVIKAALRLPDAPYPTDIYTVETNTFWAVLSYPYLALAQGLVAATLTCAWLTSRSPAPARFAATAALAFVLAATHAYDLLIVYTVLGSAIVLEVARHRRMPWPLVAVSIIVGAVSLPIALYYRHLTTATALWTAILAQYANAGVWTPSPPHLIVLMGVPLLLAAAVLTRRWRGSNDWLFLIAWTIAGGLLPYLPVVYQIKLLTGWQFPLAILASQAWHEAWRAAARRAPLSRFAGTNAIATVGLVLLVIPTNVYLFAWRVTELRRQSTPYFAHRDEMAALAWLDAHYRPGAVVLAREEFGRLVPAYTDMHATLAHWAMTNRYFERRAAVTAFFTDASDEPDRAALQQNLGATFVVWSAAPGMRAVAVDPGESDTRVLEFTRPHARIYRVRSVP